ncbi:MAG: rod shape-determining protein MreC [Longimicrobiales bacterium]
MAYFGDTRQGRRRDDVLAGIVVLTTLVLLFLPAEVQAPVRQALRRSVLSPFIAAQAALTGQRARRVDVRTLEAERDSLMALAAATASVVEENRRLRGLLGLRARGSVPLVPAEVVRVGVETGESTFFLPVGSEHGVRSGSPVLTAGGLLGVVRAVDAESSQAVDWTHPDFRASAMTADGTVYGIVEPRRGEYREHDQLALTGAPFHSDLQPGTRIVTSGRGGTFPRGIPLGTVVGIDEADTGWRKSYILRPAVRPEAATHVLVGVDGEDAAARDLSRAWYGPVSQDTLPPTETAPRQGGG